MTICIRKWSLNGLFARNPFLSMNLIAAYSVINIEDFRLVHLHTQMNMNGTSSRNPNSFMIKNKMFDEGFIG